MIFKYVQLRSFLENLKEYGETVLFRDFDSNKKCFLVRHDVDWDLNSALKMAELESELGIKSTFFIMVSNSMYNVMTKENKNILNRIVEMGHEVGLHFDASIYNTDFELNAKIEAEVLENILKTDIRSLSLHNPSTNGLYPSFKNFINAYSKNIFHDDKYISDSRFDFRKKNPFNFIKKINEVGYIQILLHPLHYSENGEIEYVSKFQNLFLKKINAFDSIQKQNSLYKTQRENKGYKILINEN